MLRTVAGAFTFTETESASFLLLVYIILAAPLGLCLLLLKRLNIPKQTKLPKFTKQTSLFSVFFGLVALAFSAYLYVFGSDFDPENGTNYRTAPGGFLEQAAALSALISILMLTCLIIVELFHYLKRKSSNS